jgi:tetratricopeptide (TPR) repeat protein
MVILLLGKIGSRDFVMSTLPELHEKQQPALFCVSALIFCVAAFLGWIKLRYGFNFIDEGYHMTEAWRLTAGDDFFRDKFTGALRSSTLINYLIFKVHPGITLLGFRELQYGLTIISLLIFSFALYTVNRQFWFQPLIFSVFAFTGIDPVGMISNLYYQTYPHLFITLHLGLFIAGLNQKDLLAKRALYILSGMCLWLISFSLLHMSLVALSPIVLSAFVRALKIRTIEFGFRDLCFVLGPFVLCWAVFLGIFQAAYIRNVFSSIRLILSTPTHAAGTLISINWEAVKYGSVAILYILACLYSTKLTGPVSLGGVLLILSALMYAVINTSLFGLIAPYYNGWFGRPMWFVALLLAAYTLSLCYLVFKTFKKKEWNNLELSALIMIIPCLIMAVSSSIFSALGILTVLHSSIPVVGAITCLILSGKTVEKKTYLVKFMILLLFFAPFYYSTAYSDWKFTFFDVTPEQTNVQINEGFGKGIRTNQAYQDLYAWIRTTSQKYSKDNDYIISYIVSPMVHMIAGRKPALDDPFISFAEVPLDYYEKAVDFMKQGKREPRLAYVFEGMPALLPLKDGSFMWFNKQFSFPSDDPISRYVVEDMVPLEEFRLTDELKVRCFIDRAFVLQEKLRQDPDNPELNSLLADVYQKREDYDSAARYYKKVAGYNPKLIPALQNMAVLSARKGNDRAALDILKEIIAIDPDRADTYYNVACIYAKQKKIDDSLLWLRKAVEKGFHDVNLLQTDRDLDNIRNTASYREILKIQ